ncbi:MAG: mercuric transporter MerT family protein [Bacteroidota bacterium]
METASVTTGAGLIAAIVSSLCCIGPFAVGMMGIGAVGAFSVFETFRPYLIGISVILVGLSFFLSYRKTNPDCSDKDCSSGRARSRLRIGTWSATVTTVVAIAFPYLGISPAPSQAYFAASSPEEQVEFIKVPLVCGAVTEIGCGSKSKFIMLEMMKDPTVKEAWLNREGTVMAVVWNEATRKAIRDALLKSVFSRHLLTVEPLDRDEAIASLKDFRKAGLWYKGSDVDALSIEEAGIIADRMTASMASKVSFKEERHKEALRDKIKSIIQKCFLSINSYEELNDSMQRRIDREIVAVAEEFLGKGNVPDLRLVREECGLSRGDDSCCSVEIKKK